MVTTTKRRVDLLCVQHCLLIACEKKTAGENLSQQNAKNTTGAEIPQDVRVRSLGVFLLSACVLSSDGLPARAIRHSA